VVPTLAKNARMGQPQVVVINGAEAQGWASPHLTLRTLCMFVPRGKSCHLKVISD
jgi:hypothetical protein